MRRASPERGVKTLNARLSKFHSALSGGKMIKQGFRFFSLFKICLCLEYYALLFSVMLLPFPANQHLSPCLCLSCGGCSGTHAQPLLCHSSLLLQELMASRPHCSLEWRTSGKSGFTELKQSISINEEETLKIPDFLRKKSSFKVPCALKLAWNLKKLSISASWLKLG